MGFLTFLVISKPKMVRFSFCKKPLEDGNVPYLMKAPPKGMPARQAHLFDRRDTRDDRFHQNFGPCPVDNSNFLEHHSSKIGETYMELIMIN